MFRSGVVTVVLGVFLLELFFGWVQGYRGELGRSFRCLGLDVMWLCFFRRLGRGGLAAEDVTWGGYLGRYSMYGGFFFKLRNRMA